MQGNGFIQNGLNRLDCFKSANFFLSSSNFFRRLTKSEKQNKNILVIYCDVHAVGVAVDVAWQCTRKQQWENCLFYGVRSEEVFSTGSVPRLHN
jgi:hypothetical protein